MKEKIEQLSRGMMTYELPGLRLSEEKLSLSVEKGGKITSVVTLSNDAEGHMKGIAYSSHPNVTIANPQFVGSECQIEVLVNAEYLNVDTKLVGNISFVTNFGEVVLPFSVTVIPPVVQSMDGPVYNPVQFAALARNHWEEARRLFPSKEYENLISYFEPENLFLLEKLLKSPSVDQAMENFFVATHKKLPVSIETDREEINYNAIGGSFSDCFSVKKSTWGFVNLNITTNLNFIELEQESAKYDDFVGNDCELKYIVYPEKMHEGFNNGYIKVQTATQSIKIPVSAHLPLSNQDAVYARRALNRVKIKGMDNYVSFSMNQIPAGRYVSEALTLLNQYEKMSGADQTFIKLYRASLNRLAGKESLASTMINEISETELSQASPSTRAYYFYLKASKLTTTKPEIMEELYNLASDYPFNFFIALLVIKVDDRYSKNLRYRLDELKAIFDKGCHSPLLFLEAAKILNAEPLYLKDLGAFENAVVVYALKRNFASRDLAVQFTSLCLRTRTYVKLYFNALAFIYEKFQLSDALAAICQVLTKGYRKENRYFKWYEKGVEENIRITELYEYYMYSLDREVDEALDPSVLMYYVYNSKLNDRRLAYLYANIVLHKDSNPIVYENYKEKIRIFSLGQMRAGKNDKYLTVLYQDGMTDSNYAGQIAEYLGKVVFRREVTCQNPQMRYVCVAHKELNDEMIVPLIGGVAQIDVFDKDAEIFLLDASNNRFALSENTKIDNLLFDEALLGTAYISDRDNKGLILHLARKAQEMRKFDNSSLDLRKQVIAMSGITKACREEFLSEIILYFYDHASDEIPEDEFKKLNYKELSPAKRGKFIGLLILREQYTQALKIMEETGFAEVDKKLLEKFIVSLPVSVLGQSNKLLLDMAYDLFINGRRHERILIYLVNFYNGLTSDMYAIWQEACLRQVATSDFDERLLGQILFTESYLPYGEHIYNHYYRRAKNRMLIKAYFNYLSYKYLISDIPISATCIEIMKKDAYFETNDMVLLALLKQLSVANELTDNEIEFAKTWLEVLESKGKILPCFKNFEKFFRLPENMDDKIYIEYRSNPEHHITIHFSSRQDGKRIVTEEPMRNVCYGIFVKEIILFSQETVEYIITDDDGEITTKTEKQTLSGPVMMPAKAKGRFAEINAIINARNIKEKSKSIELLNEYVKKEFAISQLFREI